MLIAACAPSAALSLGGVAMPLEPLDFQELFAVQRDRLYRLLYRLTGNAANADDLLQETFLAAWRKRRQFDGRGSAGGWLLRTGFRLYLNSRHRTVRRERLVGRVRSLVEDAHVARSAVLRPDDSGEAIEFLLDRVRTALADLPDGPREAFILLRFGGISIQEISTLTGVPFKTVETRVRRATQLLADALAGLRDSLP